ncbi:cell wall-binding repeat-containing protein [Ornithinimicrobium pekingense]|uniref:Peptidoglycan recognition protein family domain-containing protein n=1 Tax=Ornithinimicrobium pekingense TaxID=384677 RepID=A0ABQ2F2Z8_9MICO|nr:cell wall-binding repeat-containing protein [Ornithinimicrobium pekingense]GGK55682.1 hypothetical protein GCM10011509_00020 [Ornithinimicrobium pekingense]
MRTSSHPPSRRPLLAALTLPAVTLLTAALTVSGAAAAPVVDDADPQAAHRSVPLAQDLAASSARQLPGTDDAAATASAEPVSTATLSLGEGVHVLGLRWEGPQPEAAELRVREPGAEWGDWAELDDVVPTEPFTVEVETATQGSATGASGAPVDGTQEAPRATTGDVVVGAAEVQVRLVGEATDASLEAWTTQRTSADVASVQALPITTEEIAIGTRADWGVDESMRGTKPRHLVHDTPQLGVTVHHTAGINDYAAVDVPSIIRGIFYYHGQTLGWGDIGYAALVDKYGRTWEGRAGGVEENLQLAHAFGMNRDWAGIAVLGNHETAQVWRTELDALSELTAWTLDTHGVTAGTTVRYTNAYEGWTRTLPVVHAHRDVGLTLCPGYSMYALMDTLRAWVVTDQRESSDAVQRIGGADRYAVSAALAREAFLEGTRSAYLVSGHALPDALGVGAVADATGAAVLLTRPTAVPRETLQALQHLGVRDITLVGGEGVIPPAIADDLTARGYTVRRVTGEDRYATAAQLAAQHPRPGGTVYVADGVGLIDALGGAAAAAEQDGTVLLARSGRLPITTGKALLALAPSRVVVLGGEGVLSPAVMEQIVTLLPQAAVERVGGTNRFATSGQLAQHAFDGARSAVVASGDAPVDAMVGTQLAARHGGPVVLARSSCRPSEVDAAYQELGITLSRLAGGPGVLEWPAGHAVC